MKEGIQDVGLRDLAVERFLWLLSAQLDHPFGHRRLRNRLDVYRIADHEQQHPARTAGDEEADGGVMRIHSCAERGYYIHESE
ncbi:hypothetical protein [Paenibacillus sacheonensis]|uniref:Uncharacterized protein n=1 Tax=Paenibacillus sacheonensis TaxID=742054 RepID=A0A7X5BWB8_9BACL|nr:hypothetical protein [Paenibacillus sacheonensis]MBM7564732.1 hypothetical protein [Paenibacillus sacheonensis]NBC69288.1 hypothetical protein [Paenibacillus sacheonensis]